LRVWVANGAWLSAYRFLWTFSEVAPPGGERQPSLMRFAFKPYTTTFSDRARTVICRVEGSRTYLILLPSH